MFRNVVQDIRIKNNEKESVLSIGREKNGFNLAYSTEKLNNGIPSIQFHKNDKEHVIFETAREALQYVVNEAYKNSVIDSVKSTTAVYICKEEIQEITNTKELIIH